MEDPQVALDAVKAATTVLKESVDAGMYLGKKCVPQLAIFVEVGLVVRTIIGFSEPGQKDPVLKEIGDLKNKFDKIEEKMKENFDDLKAFISEYSFYNDVPLTGALLFQSWQEASNNPGEISREEFRERCEATQPLEYARRLQHQLMKTTTNPLRMTMAADPIKGTETFEKWKQNYDSVFTQLCLIEAMASGLLYDKDMHRVELIKKEYELFEKRVDEWKKGYQTDDHFWPDAVRKIVEDVQDHNQQKSSDEKAEMIRKKLENILTDDIFTIVVFRQSYDHSYYANLPDQILISLNRGDCKVIVYRSKIARQELKQVEDFKKNMDVLRKRNWQSSEFSFPNADRVKRATNGLLRDSGFVVMIRDGEYVGVRYTKTDVIKDGPGAHYNSKLRFPLLPPPMFSPPPMPFFMFSTYK